MRERPIQDLVEGLRQLGVDAQCTAGTGCPPVAVQAAGLPSGQVTGGIWALSWQLCGTCWTEFLLTIHRERLLCMLGVTWSVTLGTRWPPVAAWSAGLPCGHVKQRPLQQPCCELRMDGSTSVCLWGEGGEGGGGGHTRHRAGSWAVPWPATWRRLHLHGAGLAASADLLSGNLSPPTLALAAAWYPHAAHPCLLCSLHHVQHIPLCCADLALSSDLSLSTQPSGSCGPPQCLHNDGLGGTGPNSRWASPAQVAARA